MLLENFTCNVALRHLLFLKMVHRRKRMGSLVSMWVILKPVKKIIMRRFMKS